MQNKVRVVHVEKFSVLLQVVNGFEILVDKSRSIFSFQLKCYPLVFKVTKRLAIFEPSTFTSIFSQ